LVRTADELGPVVLLAGEYEEWVRARILADYGIDFEFKSERDLFLDLDGLLEPSARLYIAEINGEPVGIGGLKRSPPTKLRSSGCMCAHHPAGWGWDGRFFSG
jgi:hypothetical protein